MLRALLWLQRNNTYYKDIPLDPVALAQLPEDGQLPGLPVVTLSSQEEVAGDQGEQSDTDSEHLSHSFIPR